MNDAEAYGVKLNKKGEDVESIKSVYRQEDVAKTYDQKRFKTPAGIQKHHLESIFIRNAVTKEELRAIDIAGGTGRLSLELAKAKAKVTIFDQSPEMLAEAKKILKNYNVNFEVGDAFKLPYSEKSFDIVLMMRFLRHFSGEERNKLFHEAHRILDEKGILIFDECNLFRHKRQIKKRGVHDHLSTRKEMLKEIKSHGFKPIKVVGMLHGLEVLYRIKFPIKLITAIDKLISKMNILDFMAYQWLVICEKDET